MNCPFLDIIPSVKMLGGFLNWDNCKNCFKEKVTHDSFREVFFEVVLYCYKSTFWLCIEYSFYDWGGTPNHLIDTWICRISYKNRYVRVSLSVFLDNIKMSISTAFPPTVRLWNSCRMVFVTYDLSGFISSSVSQFSYVLLSLLPFSASLYFGQSTLCGVKSTKKQQQHRKPIKLRN